nr:MAG TPA: hypothetical protein [Caudoviricetes sp.]
MSCILQIVGYNARTKSINETLPPGGVFAFLGLASAGLSYSGRQNVTHPVLCRKSIWRPFIQAHCLTGS